MPADHTAGEIDDVARLKRVWLETFDDIGVATGWNETDILAVVLLRHGKSKSTRQFAHFRLRHVTEREAQVIQLLTGGREQEVALIAVRIGSAHHRTRSIGKAARRHVVPGCQRGGAKVARGRQQIAKLDRTIALDARHRRLAQGIALGKILDHRLAETALIVQHVMRNANPFRNVASVVDVLTGATGSLAMGGGAVIVELKRNADDVVAFRLQQRSRGRRIDAARHRNHDPRVLGTSLDIQTVSHRRSCSRSRGASRAFGIGCIGSASWHPARRWKMPAINNLHLFSGTRSNEWPATETGRKQVGEPDPVPATRWETGL